MPKLRIKKDRRIRIDVDEDARPIIPTPPTLEYIHSLRGKYKGKGLLKAWLAEKQREKKR
jgi:hypothetical protein